MILEVSPDSTALVRVAAATVLYMHIGGGTIGILSGAAAVVVPKGGRLHRIVGNVFFVSMLIMSAIGALVSPFLPQPDWINVVAGMFTFYLVATAWLTVRCRAGNRRTEIGTFVFAMAVALAGITIGVVGIMFRGSVGSSPAGAALVFGTIAALAAAGDLRMIQRGGISGRQRVGRHLWRMCLALLIATGSLFGGQPQLFPDWVRGTPLLYLPVLAVLGAMIFWMSRVRFAKQWQAR